MKKLKLLFLFVLGLSFSSSAQTPFWTSTTYKGAFPVTDNTPATDWTYGWSNFGPENTNYPSTTSTISSDITTNTTLSGTVLLQNKIYVTNGAVLTILPGTIIRGDQSTQGTLIITKGCKIIANGTQMSPIVFTSNQSVGNRAEGDWGGLVILGQATNNQPGGIANIEGIAPTANTQYGGSNDDDNSGVLKYVRVEFAGVALQPNKEINGVTFGSVGSKTLVDYVQVSFSGDDSFEWFGGTVNCKHLIAYKGIDDDFDTDFGYRGMVQFGLIVRDPAIADQSQSNGFESDNDGTGSSNLPQTAPIFSNITVIGPKQLGTPAGLYRRAMHLRRNTCTSIYNSIFAGYPTGLHIDGVSTQSNATNNLLQLERIMLVNMTSNFEQTNGANTWAGVLDYFNSPDKGNVIANTLELDLFYLPLANSPILNSASFTNPKLTNSFFTPVPYIGAFGTTNWASTWTKF